MRVAEKLYEWKHILLNFLGSEVRQLQSLHYSGTTTLRTLRPASVMFGALLVNSYFVALAAATKITLQAFHERPKRVS